MERSCGQTALGLWDDLLRFDVKVSGYSFAWLFYMLDGNRIGSWAGERAGEKILDAAW